jgi:hypothetical protein
MRLDDLSLSDLCALRETLAVLEKIGRLDAEARFDLTPNRPVRVTLPSLARLVQFDTGGGASSMAEPEPAGVAVAALPPPDANTRGGLSPVAREGEAIAEIPPSPGEVGASVPASDDCEPVAPARAVDHTAAPVAAAVPAGGGATPPAVPDIDDELGQHLMSLTRKGDWHIGADHRLMDLACLGWRVPEIAGEMERGDLDVKRRFDLLLDGRKFKREDVRDRLAGFLALAAE